MAPGKSEKCKFLLTLRRGNDLLSHSAKCRRHKGANLHLCLGGEVNLSGALLPCDLSSLGCGGSKVQLSWEKLFAGVTSKRMCVELFLFSVVMNQAQGCGGASLPFAAPSSSFVTFICSHSRDFRWGIP